MIPKACSGPRDKIAEKKAVVVIKKANGLVGDKNIHQSLVIGPSFISK